MAVEYIIHGGVTVLIDEEDLAKVSTRKWYVVGKSVRNSKERLSHFVAGRPPKGLVAAHWDGNFLNNQKSNIRHVTQRMNMARDLRHTKGYYWDRSRGCWQVSIGVNNRRVNGGRYVEEMAAAQAAKDLREKLQGV